MRSLQETPSNPEKDKIYDAEIVGLKPPLFLRWKNNLHKFFVLMAMAIAGIGVCLIGFFLTITIVGAALGIPLILLGLGILLLAVFSALSKGPIDLQIIKGKNLR